jgi:hypothetical protein
LKASSHGAGARLSSRVFSFSTFSTGHCLICQRERSIDEREKKGLKTVRREGRCHIIQPSFLYTPALIADSD